MHPSTHAASQSNTSIPPTPKPIADRGQAPMAVAACPASICLGGCGGVQTLRQPVRASVMVRVRVRVGVRVRVRVTVMVRVRVRVRARVFCPTRTRTRTQIQTQNTTNNPPCRISISNFQICSSVMSAVVALHGNKIIPPISQGRIELQP